MAESVLIIIETIDVMDREQFSTYQQQARHQLASREGVVVARGGEVFEGDPRSGPVLIQRWPSEKAFRDWQESDEYRPLLEIRQKAAKLRLTIVPEV